HAGRSLTVSKAQAHRRRYRFRDERKHLPVRHLSAHSPGYQTSVRSNADRSGWRGGAEMSRIELVTRRTFLGSLVSAGAFVLGARLLPVSAGATVGGASTLRADEAAFHPSIFLGIEPDGTVIIVAHRSEMGTGCRTGLPTVVAEELDTDWSRIKVEQAL